MKYRNVAIVPFVTLTGVQTYTMNIHLEDIISRITLMWSVGKIKTGMDSYPHRDITRIELVDGSDVLFSMDGGQAAALNIYDRRAQTYWNGISINANEVHSWYSIDFGRWLFDEMLALVPRNFHNLQLRVTVNPALCEVGCASGDLKVFADVFDEQVPSPTGFLMSKEHFRSGTPDVNAYTYIDLPTDFPIRKLLVQGYKEKKTPWDLVSEARLDEENTKRIPFDWELYTYYELRKSIDKPIQEDISGETTPGQQILYTTPTDYWCTIVPTPFTGGTGMTPGAASPGGVFDITPILGSAYLAVVKGWLPNHCFCFPFGYQKDISDWYDVTRLGHVRLRLRSGATEAAAQQAVILQQNRGY